MEGTETVRFCDQCQLNVHNLSRMSDNEVTDLLEKKNGRMCVFMYQREDGTVITDNCPVALRAMRSRIQAYAYVSLLALVGCLAFSLNAHGSVSAPIDPRFLPNNEVGQLADYSYDTARVIAKIVTVTTFAVVTVITYAVACYVPLPSNRKSNLRLAVFLLVAGVAIPVLADLAGDMVINNFGGLGGGGI